MDNNAESFLERAKQAQEEGKRADARRNLLEAVSLLRQGGRRAELAKALRTLGELERRTPDADEARLHYEEAVAIFREEGEPLRLAHTIRHLGEVHYESGRPDLAEPCYLEALALYRSHEHAAPLDLANAIRVLAVLKTNRGESEEATSLWQEAHDLYTRCNVSSGLAESMARMAQIGARKS
ncbi:MAG TPA: tetratricopeptide repeat protein [Pyrinomonadaceae bacterium]|jgi:tetratricopeptide (TPR) repeat protein